MRNGSQQREKQRDFSRQLDILSAHKALDAAEADEHGVLSERIQMFLNETLATVEHLRIASHVEYERAELANARRLQADVELATTIDNCKELIAQEAIEWAHELAIAMDTFLSLKFANNDIVKLYESRGHTIRALELKIRNGQGA